MSNIPISSLPPAISLNGTEDVPLVQGGTTKRASVSEISTFPAATGAFVVAVASPLLTQSRLLSPEPGVTTVTDGGALGDITVGIATNGIGNTQLRQGSALSVIGNSTNATANEADITAASDFQILRRDGTSLGFGSIDLSQGNAVGSSILSPGNGGTGVNNGSSTLTLGGSLTTVGTFTSTFTMTGDTSVTFPTSGTLATTGGPSLPSVAQGDLLYGSATNVLSTLPKNTTATRYLANTGTSNNPAWDQVNLTNGVTGTLPTGNGGTGIANPTAHALLIGNGSGALSQLAPSATAGVALVSQGASADPAYGTVVVAGGGTGLTSYTLGDVIYASAANTLARLAGNITTGKQYLSQTGTGAVSAAPVWAAIAGGDITGAALTVGNDTNVTLTLGGAPATSLLRAASVTAGWTGLLAVGRGGTGLSSGTSGGVLAFTGTGTLASSGLLTSNAVMIGGGAGATPSTIAAATNGQILVGSTSLAPAFQTLSGDISSVTNTGVVTVANSAITNAKLANAGAYTLKGNFTASSAAPTDTAIGSLTQKVSPAAGDYLLIADNAASGQMKYATVASVASAGSVASIDGATGAFTTTNGITTVANAIQLTAARRTLPTIQRFTSGSGTYTTPANCLWIKVTIIGGGGAGGWGGAGGTSSGGGNTTFGTLTAGGGGAGAGSAGAPGAGGSNSGSLGSDLINQVGGAGGGYSNVSSGFLGGTGGNSILGGGGPQALQSGGGANGVAGIANTGGGGSGGSTATTGVGTGGGSGASRVVIVGSPAASYSYAVGAGGTSSGGSISNGGAGGSGIVVVEEHYGS